LVGLRATAASTLGLTTRRRRVAHLETLESTVAYRPAGADRERHGNVHHHQFFDIWDQPLGPGEVGQAKGRVGLASVVAAGVATFSPENLKL
jgi:hypothetical protein